MCTHLKESSNPPPPQIVKRFIIFFKRILKTGLASKTLLAKALRSRCDKLLIKVLPSLLLACTLRYMWPRQKKSQSQQGNMSKFPSQARFRFNQAALGARPGRWRVERQGVSCRNETRRLVRKGAACTPSVSSWKTGVIDQAKGRDACER